MINMNCGAINKTLLMASLVWTMTPSLMKIKIEKSNTCYHRTMQYEMTVLKVGDRVAGIIVGALRPYRGLVAEISANPDDPYPVRVVSEVCSATFGVAYSEISEINGVAV